VTHRSVPNVLHPAVEEGRLAEHGRHVGRVVEVEVRRRKITLKKDGITDACQKSEVINWFFSLAIAKFMFAAIYAFITKVLMFNFILT